MMKIIIEHLEDEMFDWSICEYKRLISELQDRVAFTRVLTHHSSKHFPEFVSHFSDKSILDLQANISRICLLDEQAESLLTPKDASEFDFCLVGGILGNVDEFDADRTKELRNLGFPRRHLGAHQMTADTAAIVADLIVNQGKEFGQLEFVDRPEFPVGPGESIIFPFRLLRQADGKPAIAEGILEMLIDDGF